MGQMGYVGPMLNSITNFIIINLGKVNLEKRYFKISERIYKELDERLSKSEYLSERLYNMILQFFLDCKT